MFDTPPEVEAQLDSLMAKRSGSDRIRIMSEMFELARALAISDIRSIRPHATEVEVRLALFDRLYGEDLSAEECRGIRARLAVGTGQRGDLSHEGS